MAAHRQAAATLVSAVSRAQAARPAARLPAASLARQLHSTSSSGSSTSSSSDSTSTSAAAAQAAESKQATSQQRIPQRSTLPGANFGLDAQATPSTSNTSTELPGVETASTSRPAREYSPLTKRFVWALARLLGYNTTTSTAIRTTSDFYDRCAERAEVEAPFFYEECMLPPSFQTWFSITTLHAWLCVVRLRALPSPLGETYIQELVNHLFIDTELRIRGPYAVSQQRLIKGYMHTMLEQYNGAIAAYDQGLMENDAALAAALWRNLFGAGWGAVGGVKGKRAPRAGEAPALGPNPDPEGLKETPEQQKLKQKKSGKKGEEVVNDSPTIDPARASAGHELRYPQDPDLEFPLALERLVLFIRKEVARMDKLSDEEVAKGFGAPNAILSAFEPIPPSPSRSS